MFSPDKFGITASVLKPVLLAFALTAVIDSYAQDAGKSLPDLSASSREDSSQSEQSKTPGEKSAPYSLSVRRIVTQPGFPEIGEKADAVFASALQVQGQSFDALTGLCAPELSPATAYRIAFEFSGGKPWAVSIRGGSVVAADSEEHALALIRNLKEKGKSVSIGFFQIPEEFISHSGSDLESALEPCRNLKMGSAFLFSRYRDYLGRHGMNFLAARQALEDLRAASGRGTRFTHSIEKGVSDYSSQTVTVKVKAVEAEFKPGQQPGNRFSSQETRQPDSFVVVRKDAPAVDPDKSENSFLAVETPAEKPKAANKSERAAGSANEQKANADAQGRLISRESPKRPKPEVLQASEKDSKNTQRRLREKKNVFAVVEEKVPTESENPNQTSMRIF
ncbi:hypothetical protein [Parasutterella sp.]|jgi:type IV secretion system protein virB1|uniref:hypothetical protein n=1 Tax=Parasutterella sp. TaxID=2049037 RepID=UPI003AB394F0